MLFPRHKQQRIHKPWSLVVAGSVLLLVVGWNQWMYVMKQMPACTFRALTGWLCPGCGARRSIVALSRGDLLLALRTNALIYFFGRAGMWIDHASGLQRMAANTEASGVFKLEYLLVIYGIIVVLAPEKYSP